MTINGGASDGYEGKSWNVEIQRLASFLGIPIHVSHFPPGMWKWNCAISRLFSYIISDWEG
jgi:hypothetical protein